MMQYRNGYSALGFGCMRFTRSGGIDVAKAEREILRAFELGVNYYDTAYIYPGSEDALGQILSRNSLRDSVRIATKLPQYLIKSPKGIDRYFSEQLKRLRTDRVDNYLMHMLTDLNAWQKLQALGIEEWIDRRKAEGSIGRIGFSFHGNTEMFLRILNAYSWDFCQIQYNYLDEHSQAGRAGLEAAAARGIPVIIMEPLRGGKLVTQLPPKARERIAAHPGLTPAGLALRWLWDQPGVTCILSGMNSMDMVEENCRLAAEAVPGCLSEEERTLIGAVRDDICEKLLIGCTGCGYCMPCPKGVDIPGTFRCYNEMSMESKSAGRHEYLQVVSLRRDPGFATRCVGCGRCEQHCPQHLPIIGTLRKADRALRPLHYRLASGIARKWLYRGRRAEARNETTD